MKKIFSAFVVLAALTSVARADFNPAGWQYRKDLIPGEGTGSFGEIIFDSQVLSSAKSDLSDVRIMSDGEEVPYVLDAEAPSFVRESYSARILNQGSQGNSTSLVLDLGQEGVIHNRAELAISSFNFRRSIQVEGSSDMSNWLKLADGSIYDYTLEFKARNTSVAYGDSTYRYLRVTIYDNGETPLKVSSATVSREAYSAGKNISYSAPIVERADIKERQANTLIFDLGIKGLPTNRLILSTADTNFNREVGLEGTNDGKDWRVILQRDVIFSYDTPKFSGSKLELRFPDQSYRYLRLTIFNRDNQPIRIDNGTLYGTVRKAVFPYEAGREYRLYYGNPSARYAQYDLRNYLQYYDASARIKFDLGDQSQNSSYEKQAEPQKPFTERYSWLLTATLILVVALLGFMVFRLFKKQSSAK